MPVSKYHEDETYYAPLKGFGAGREGREFESKYFARQEDLGRRPPELYLGLVHPDDEEGTRERVERAKEVLGSREFGVVPECGMGRMPEEFVSIMSILKNVSWETSATVGHSYNTYNMLLFESAIPLSLTPSPKDEVPDCPPCPCHLVASHGFVQNATISGKEYDPQRISREIQGNGRVEDGSLIDLECGGNSREGFMGSKPAPLHAKAIAGETVNLSWMPGGRVTRGL
ncbi:hypothetical protein K469DRAFT_689125 [Zopfia rhizophila CBS 207.26]|uniref:Uncharacterized protein n=1 Tax=Zopfia rhizophila CBS 207.26 TaxID=1314779 RepID=A0A6A6EPF5_9PEZI|nr:hypothetical protein K469DRAFT_689125 [Zopfia rhizophila CBS 207.26]